MPRNDERSVSDVLQDIFGNLQDIVRSEIRLAKADLKGEARKAGEAGKPLLAGVVCGVYAGALLMLGLVYALSLVIAPWLAAVSLSVVLFAISAVLVGIGRARLRILNPASHPTPTLENVKEKVHG
jgi:Putative Actinobacterial Holin-X, holin superfamily III